MPGFLGNQMINQLRRSRAQFYDDTLEFRITSGTDAGAASTWTLPDGSTVADVWGREETNATRVGVTVKKLILSGNFTWLPSMDRSQAPIGMIPGAEAAFACGDRAYTTLNQVSGVNLWAVKESQQLRIMKIVLAESTGEMVLYLGKTREDF